MLPSLHRRDNMLERRAEPWRPLVFRSPDTWWSRCNAMMRRMLDLQAASIWNDLRQLLVECRGDLLDVGCGAQPYRSLLPSSVRYQGIDTVNAKDHFGYSVPDTLYFDGDVWPIESGSVDVVLATETLEHVSRPAQFLAEAKRCLRPEGYLLLTIPFAARWHYIPNDYWRFTPSGIDQTLSDAGFGPSIVYARGDELTVGCYKIMALILVLILGQFQSNLATILSRFAGVMLVPVLIPLAVIGQLSLRSRGGNDCLGYTVVSRLNRS